MQIRTSKQVSKIPTGNSDALPSVRSIVALALPALLVLSATPLYLLWDTAVVGSLGSRQLASLAAGATVLGIVTTQLTFLSYGTTARAAQLAGAGRLADAVYEGVQASWVAVGVGSVLATVVWCSAPWVMGLFSQDPLVVAEATSWLRVAAVAVVPALLVLAGNGWLRGLGNTRLPMWLTLAGVIPMAVTVPWSVGRWGVVGSAYANVLGECLTAFGFVVVLWWTWRRVGDGRSLWPRWEVIRAQLLLGRDLILRSLSFQVTFVSAAVVAGSIAPAALAAHQVLLQLWNLVTLVLDAVAIAAQALVGAALGAGNVARARAVGWVVLRCSMVMAGAVAVVLWLGRGWFPRLFIDDAEVLAVIASPWMLLIVVTLLGGVVFAIDGVLLGAADVVFLRNATIVAALGGFLPLIWLSWLCDWGVTGIWWGLVAFVLLRLVAVVRRVRGAEWTRGVDWQGGG